MTVLAAAVEEFGLVAQSVEQRTENPCVGGSIPPQATIECRMQVAPSRGDLHFASPRQGVVHKAWQQVSHQEYNDVRFRRLSSCKKLLLQKIFQQIWSSC